ncbi:MULTISPECIES: helix-turn-helix domain-containing protein [unclassified Streptomyces]|uniref:MarR family transcriptional regulator n=1 Tax=Streptomyces sp. 2112.3 TaxID=1881023 RepID=UPI000A5D6C04
MRGGDASTTREAARHINIDAGAVSRLVDRLVAKGLLRPGASGSPSPPVRHRQSDIGKVVHHPYLPVI